MHLMIEPCLPDKVIVSLVHSLQGLFLDFDAIALEVLVGKGFEYVIWQVVKDHFNKNST